MNHVDDWKNAFKLFLEEKLEKNLISDGNKHYSAARNIEQKDLSAMPIRQKICYNMDVRILGCMTPEPGALYA